MIREVHLYDFDGTLFRSPHAPATWGPEWWGDIASLTPPCVPERPDSSWWISSTVKDARRSTTNADVFSVMMTGRDDRSGFRYRVPELLSQAGLKFDKVYLSKVDDTISGKSFELRKILSRFPDAHTLRVWDDRISHLKRFGDIAAAYGLEYIPTHVRVRSKEPECEEGFDIGAVPDRCKFVGVFLDARSKALLAERFPFAHGKIKNDHVTLCLGPGLQDKEGGRVSMKVVGYAEDDLAQAVVVELPRGLMQDDRIPHITLSHDKSVEAKYSNDLLRRGFQRVDGPVVTGYIDSSPRRLLRKATLSQRVAKLYLDL